MAETLVTLPDTVWGMRQRIGTQPPALFEKRWFLSRTGERLRG